MSPSRVALKLNSKNDFEKYIEIIINNKENHKQLFHCKKEKVSNNFTILTFQEHDLFTKYNYNIQQLKTIANHYKLKTTGNKFELTTRIYRHLFLSYYALKIQKHIRGKLHRKYIKYHGPAFLHRHLCTNTSDFLTMDEMKDIQYEQFFSYKDNDGFIYGFDLVSLHNLIYKSNGIIKNPYNRRNIPNQAMEEFKTLFRLSKLFKIPISVEIKDIESEITPEKSTELRILSLFQNIDSLGNYSSPSWFSSLNQSQLIKFIRELMDIWSYRAQLSLEIKRNICPPLGNPFQRLQHITQLQNIEFSELKKIVLVILEKFVNLGVDQDSKSLGAYYVLAALTLVNEDAAIALPWLYQSVSHI